MILSDLLLLLCIIFRIFLSHSLLIFFPFFTHELENKRSTSRHPHDYHDESIACILCVRSSLYSPYSQNNALFRTK